VSVAVAVDGGLITPVVRNADTKGLATISAEMKDFATRAREGKLMPEEYQGGGFSVSNLGMFGIREFSAIINPPQSGILAIGAGEQRPVVKDGALAVATVMTCSLSGDHRVIDGAVGAEFLAAYKALIEDPLTMLL
jgi:pyruvate dehydrogenase E2 component (dihydrolipoamide acetyltransferase)